MTTEAHRAEKQAIVSSLADIRNSRAVTAPGPSGNTYRIRPLNMERYALAGGLPASLRELALKGAEGVAEVLGEGGQRPVLEGLHGAGGTARQGGDRVDGQVGHEAERDDFALIGGQFAQGPHEIGVEQIGRRRRAELGEGAVVESRPPA